MGWETRGPVSTGFGTILAGFTSDAGIPTHVEPLDPAEPALRKYTNEFWTSRQR